MAPRTARLDIPLLLPGPPEERRRRLDHFLRHVRQEPGVRDAHAAPDAEQPVLHVEIDQKATPVATLERLARHAGIGFRERWGLALWRVDGMVSPQSASAIEAVLAGIPGVHATASFASRTLRLEFDRAACALPDVAMRLARLGFRVEPVREKRPIDAGLVPAARLDEWLARALALPREHAELFAAVSGAILLLAGFVAEQAGAPPAAAIPVYLLAYVAAGWYTARDTLLSLARWKFNIDVLMFVAAIGAALLGHFAEGALLLVLFAFGHAGEDLAMERARRAIQSLHEVAPDTATLKSGGALKTVRVEELKVGDVVLVRPGERVPADGAVLAGVSSVDQSAITGESVPVEKGVGASVFAGTMNGDGALDVRVAKAFSESTLAKAIRLVEEAQTRKGPTELFTARVERWYVPAVLVGTGALLLVMPVVEGGAAESWKTWFYRSMAFLTAASPCALAIGTPAATLSALARAARMGVLIKGGAHLEALGRLRAVAYDKTGTLTVGRPRVVGVRTLPGAEERDVVFTAAAVEAGSTHPLAAAIVAFAKEQGWEERQAESVEQIVGMGLRGRIDGEPVEVGSARLFADDSGADAALALLQELQAQGATPVAVRRAGRVLGVIALADEPRADAVSAIADMRALGVRRQVMLTGDHEAVAASLARRLGLDEHHAGLLPADKMRIIDQMREHDGVVAMLGDGVNDAPALAAASVGVAMGVAGSDVALETADVALMHDDLTRFPESVALARFARTIIIQNLLLALGVIVVLAPAAAFGLATIGVAVVFHEGSTVVVVLNALRLLAFRPKPRPPSPAPEAPREPGAQRRPESALAAR